MGDLISRAAAIDTILNDERVELNYGDVSLEGVIKVIESLPTVDAVPVVHARWRELKDGAEECTNCHGLCPHEENYNGDIILNFGCEYCPWCGAKMDREE